MGDRYSDRYDAYDDGYGDAYGSQRGSSRRYPASSRDSGYGDYGSYDDYGYSERTQRSSRSYDRQSSTRQTSARQTSVRQSSARQTSTRQSTRGYSSGYDDGYRDSRRGDSSSRRPYQGGDSQSRRTSYSDGGYYADDQADAYRRSSYGSRSSGTTTPRTRTTSQRSSRSTASTADRTPHARRVAGDTRATRSTRDAAVASYAPKRSNKKRNLIIAAVVVVAIVLVGAGMAFAYVKSISDNLHAGVDDDLRNALVSTSLANEPFYMLLMGTDTSVERVETEEDGDTVRSDSMMLARVDPVNKKVTLLSIDRDTMVDMGDEYGQQKINAAYQLGGAAGAVKAVSTMAGVDIAHYASVDFDGFRAIVDALGGVEVDVPMAIDDDDAGGRVDAGLQTLNGDQALILCRARHAYDDIVAAGDVIRAAYQRMILSAIAKKVLSSDVLTIANTVKEMSQYVTTDLDVSDIIGLAQVMQGLDTENDIYTGREPTQSLYLDDVWYELLDEEEWQKMVSRMEQGLPPSENTEIDDATGVTLSTAGSGAPVI